MTEKIYAGFKKDRELAIQRSKILREQAELMEKQTKVEVPIIESDLMAFNKSIKREKSSYRLPTLKLDYANKLTEEVVIDLFVEGYYNALNIDDFIKLTEESQIKENADIFFTELVKRKTVNGLFESCKSNKLREALLIIEAVAGDVAAEDIDNSVDSDDDPDIEQSIDKVKEKVSTSSVATKALSSISKEVAKKVKATINNEKEIAEKNREIEEELVTEGKQFYRKTTDTTLFRSIFQNVSSGALQESTNINPEFVFTEAELQYTLLEYANTTRLVDFTPQLVKELSRAYREI